MPTSVCPLVSQTYPLPTATRNQEREETWIALFNLLPEPREDADDADSKDQEAENVEEEHG